MGEHVGNNPITCCLQSNGPRGKNQQSVSQSIDNKHEINVFLPNVFASKMCAIFLSKLLPRVENHTNLYLRKIQLKFNSFFRTFSKSKIAVTQGRRTSSFLKVIRMSM